MVRRWLIRGLALTLLTLCVVAGVGSYWQRVDIHRAGQGHYLVLVIKRGRVYGRLVDAPTPFPQWGVSHFPAFNWSTEDDDIPFKYLGFLWHHTVWQTEFSAPLWFPTLLSALMLWFVWRKTRSKYNGKGFPVEAAGKEATKP